MGLAIGYSVALSIPFVGANLARSALGRAVPRRRGVLVADVHRARPGPAGADRRLLAGCTSRSSRARHHTQFRAAPAADASGGSSACRRSRPRRRARSASLFAVAAVLFLLGGLVQINPVWLWGPYHVGDRDERRAARLVPRLADRRAAARAGLRRRDRRLHRRAEPVLGRRALPARRLRRCSTSGRGSSARDAATARFHNLLERPRDNPWRTALGVGVRDAGSSSSSSPAPPIASTSSSASPTSARSGSTACSSGSARSIAFFVAKRVCEELVAGERVAKLRKAAENRVAATGRR